MIGMSKWQHRGKNYAWKSWSNSIFLAQYAPKDIDKSEKLQDWTTAMNHPNERNFFSGEINSNNISRREQWLSTDLSRFF